MKKFKLIKESKNFWRVKQRFCFFAYTYLRTGILGKMYYPPISFKTKKKAKKFLKKRYNYPKKAC